jgi:hypothetical protein
MTTSERVVSLSDERKLELVSQTLHEIRGDTKWIREEVSQFTEGVNTRISKIEKRLNDLEEELGLKP